MRRARHSPRTAPLHVSAQRRTPPYLVVRATTARVQVFDSFKDPEILAKAQEMMKDPQYVAAAKAKLADIQAKAQARGYLDANGQPVPGAAVCTAPARH